jgi:hypothetical protein
MRKIILTLSIFVLCSCEKVINLDLSERDSRLIVEGLITNDTVYVNLTKTSKYNFKYDPSKVEYLQGATVIVTDNTGKADTLFEKLYGKFIANKNKLSGIIGQSYKVDIFTSEGKHFASTPEVMMDVAKIDSIYFERDPTKLYLGNKNSYLYDIYINWHEPANETNYYLRNMSYFWNKQWHDNVQWNWVFNDKYINGNYLKKENVNESYGGKYWTFKLNQYSLTKKAYDFWNLVHEQTQEGGNFSNSAVPLIGNVVNVDNPDDYALGYFQVSAITTAEVYINK